jgi:hypothetical protein
MLLILKLCVAYAVLCQFMLRTHRLVQSNNQLRIASMHMLVTNSCSGAYSFVQ